MTSRGLHRFLSVVVAVAIALPMFGLGATSRHRPLQQRRVPAVAQVRGAQALAARISALKELSRRSRASQPLLLVTAHDSTAGAAVARHFFPLRC
jgi:hypothetical protein